MMKITTPCLLYNPSEEVYSSIIDMMQHFCPAKRYAYKRLEENRGNGKFKAHCLAGTIQQKYKLNSRQAKDAIEQARQMLRSQEELLELHIREYETKVEKLLKKFDNGVKPEQRNGLVSKLDKRLRKLCRLLKHKQDGTLPPVVFGGKDNFYKRCKGSITREEYKLRRNNQFLSRGDRTKKGNPNLRIVLINGETFLEITTLESTTSEPKLKTDGTYSKPNPYYRKIMTPIYIPQKLSKKTGRVNGYNYRSALLLQVTKEKPYQVELLHRDGRIYAHVTFEIEKTDLTCAGQSMTLGVDTNPDGLALTMIDSKGNYRWHFYLKEPKLLTAQSSERSNLCGEMAMVVVRIAKVYGCAVSAEDLSFMNDRDVKAKLARKTAQFCYRKILTMLETACFKHGVEFINVKPQYSSIIGLYKYCHQYGMDVHNGAAMVIARRSYGFKEKVPKLYKSFFRPITVDRNNELAYEEAKYSSEWSNWSNVSGKMKQILRNDCNPRFFIENRREIRNMILA